jgi:Domain of unknown function (DUF4389)
VAYPVNLDVDYGDGQRSKGLAVCGILFPVKTLLAIPHFIALWFVSIGVFFATWFGYWGIALNGELSPGIARFLHNYLGWTTRVTAWLASWRDEYPAFATEQPDYPAKVIVTEPSLERGRGLAWAGIIFFLKAVLLIPHLVVLYFVQIAAAIAGWVAYWIIAFTGEYPRGIFDFTVGTMRWYIRTQAWLISITDEYPQFTLSE